MKAQSQKKVQVVTTFTFNHVDRVLFVVKSSQDEDVTYNVCFSNGRGSCTCDGHEKYHKECYHMLQLRPRYEAIKAERLARARERYVNTFDPCLVA